MLKICGEPISKPLGIIFRSCLEMGSSPQNGKKPMSSESNKQKLNRPVSLLPVSGKIFERLLYESIFNFFNKNSLMSQNHSDFIPGDSCTNQLLSITHQIYKYFDDGHKVRSAFLDMPKAFDNVWHKGHIFKLKQNSI